MLAIPSARSLQTAWIARTHSINMMQIRGMTCLQIPFNTLLAALIHELTENVTVEGRQTHKQNVQTIQLQAKVCAQITG